MPQASSRACSLPASPPDDRRRGQGTVHEAGGRDRPPVLAGRDGCLLPGRSRATPGLRLDPVVPAADRGDAKDRREGVRSMIVLDMVCTCDDEGKTEARARLDRIRAWVDADVTPGHEVSDDADLFERMVGRMTRLWTGEITIVGDQWYGVDYVQGHDQDSGARNPDAGERISVQCDEVIDGVAAIFEQVYLR